MESFKNSIEYIREMVYTFYNECTQESAYDKKFRPGTFKALEGDELRQVVITKCLEHYRTSEVPQEQQRPEEELVGIIDTAIKEIPQIKAKIQQSIAYARVLNKQFADSAKAFNGQEEHAQGDGTEARG